MTLQEKVRAIDTETVGEPSYFSKKDKSKMDYRGHPRLFKAKLISDSTESGGQLYDPPFDKFKINKNESLVFHNTVFDLHILMATGLITMKEITNEIL